MSYEEDQLRAVDAVEQTTLPENRQAWATMLESAEKILTETFGGTSVRLGEGSNLGGSHRSIVSRFKVLAGPGSVPEYVIVKQVNVAAGQCFDPEQMQEAAWHLFNDWAALLFLKEISSDKQLAPCCYGGDSSLGFFVMEDLGQGTRLDHVLLGDDAEAAEAALLDYAAIHGRLHALTIGRQADYVTIREALGTIAKPSDYYCYNWLVPTLYTIAVNLDITPEVGVDEELAVISSSLLNPGPFLAYIQSDSCPDNCIYTGSALRLFDFEAGQFTHALLEGAYCRMPFPSCWCVYRLPESVMRKAEVAYRAELVRGCPAAADDKLFGQALAAACITWALNYHFMSSLSTMLEQDRTLVALSDRQRYLLYLRAALQASEEADHLPAIGATLRAIVNKLSLLWPEAIDPPYYPAFSQEKRL